MSERGLLLAGRVALVTGASRGIGAATARLFADEGAHVIVHYHTGQTEAEEIAARIGNGAVALGADLRDPEAARRLLDTVDDRFGRLEILINNAASFTPGKTAETAEWTDYAQEFAGVVGVTVNTTSAAIPLMKRGGYGRIVNTTATLVQRPVVDYIVHTTAKSALIGYTRTLARTLGPHGITANIVAPGIVLTEYSMGLPDELKSQVTQRTPLRRLATPEDVAKVALFYASPLADFVSSTTIAPDGGLAIF
jgi:3-oxoacyl-[acyl-carrier protein] reductase